MCEDNPKFHFVVNGMELTTEDFKLMRENTELLRETLNKLKVIKGLK